MMTTATAALTDVETPQLAENLERLGFSPAQIDPDALAEAKRYFGEDSFFAADEEGFSREGTDRGGWYQFVSDNGWLLGTSQGPPTLTVLADFDRWLEESLAELEEPAE